MVLQESSGELHRFGYRVVSLEILHRISPLISHCRTFEKTITHAYKWLVEKYTPGDRFFLFGEAHLAIEHNIH